MVRVDVSLNGQGCGQSGNTIGSAAWISGWDQLLQQCNKQMQCKEMVLL